MGLDMYLYAEKYIPAYDLEFLHTTHDYKRTDNLEYADVIEASKMDTLPSTEFASVMVRKQVGYWRKANAVHGWIVRNMADGIDECQDIRMTREDLKLLRDKCVEAIADRDNATPHVNRTIKLNESNGIDVANEIMNTMKAEATKPKTLVDDPLSLEPISGFFFGGTEKDEYYYRDLEHTIDIINSLLSNDMELDYYYRASW
jgi:hypothetical protein